VGADGERPHSVTVAVSAYAVHIILTAGILNEVSREDRKGMVTMKKRLLGIAGALKLSKKAII
jgi:hypothetical protein